MNTITVKILTVLLSIFIIITVVSQIWMALDVKYVTETAKSYSSATKETFYGIFVRDEELIKYSGGGSVSYSVSDGSKVANNAVVACIYSSDEDIKINSAIERIEEEISLLESAQSPGTTEAAQPEFMSALIDEEYQRITSELARNEINDISRNRDNYLSLLSIYQIVIGENRNYDERLDYGKIRGMGSLAYGIGGLIAGSILTIWGNNGMIAFALLSWGFVMIGGFGIPNPIPRDQTSEKDKVTFKGALRECLSDKVVVVAILGLTFAMITNNIISTYYTLLVETLGGSSRMSGLGLFVMSFFEFLVVYSFSKISAKNSFINYIFRMIFDCIFIKLKRKTYIRFISTVS